MNLVDVSVSNYPLLIIAILELIVLNYVYGYQQFADDVHLMLGKRLVQGDFKWGKVLRQQILIMRF